MLDVLQIVSRSRRLFVLVSIVCRRILEVNHLSDLPRVDSSGAIFGMPPLLYFLPIFVLVPVSCSPRKFASFNR
jgi:hypothetical protein